MKIPLNDLSRTYDKSSVMEAFSRVFDSGHWVMGKQHDEFERELGDYLGVGTALGVASGTDALEIALLSVGAKQGTKIATVANAGGYTSVAAQRIGCDIVYCDIDPKNFCISPNSLRLTLESNPEIELVVVTHLYGNVADMEQIVDICEFYKATVIEDCAQALGGSIDHRKVGTFGKVGAFSFYPTKNLGGIGDGGAVVTTDARIGENIKRLRQYGWDKKYEITIPFGKNSRLDELQAAVLRLGLPELDGKNSKRQEIVRRYSEALKGSKTELVTIFAAGNTCHLAVLSFTEQSTCAEMKNHLSANGVATSIHYPKLDYEQHGLVQHEKILTLEVSEERKGKFLTIPLFPEMTDREIQRICEILKNK